ncbi:hypothetical protein LCM20_06250 [Halobacillus litoralis]|uniref:hypothetical protein n=1 Tax=Halobacillus litoralis TaxID=45668 RepID=UPI001CD4AECA|nr:hypothetical protein [Halobacillus litoralis]MCA0970181.1 hypothetical protein [Halobacillus litoralis]
MLKFLILFLLVWVSQFLAVVMWGEYVWLEKFSNGGVGGTPMDQVQPVLWWTLVLEALVFAFLIAWKIRSQGEKKHT